MHEEAPVNPNRRIFVNEENCICNVVPYENVGLHLHISNLNHLAVMKRVSDNWNLACVAEPVLAFAISVGNKVFQVVSPCTSTEDTELTKQDNPRQVPQQPPLPLLPPSPRQTHMHSTQDGPAWMSSYPRLAYQGMLP